ncbi:hypothetical protein SYJ56_14320 [Algoriphagus sp. D3-2-R+10]|uniref:hypothetical protein n=1 Tax=Algoriphagus aurantiacus TaxID=3103948 RepID=UPI002B36C1DD|nr:hypothetical protein [Algoriphagus sp. D3-2-R+10]MEB2776494.1 hypothetical protein [Algoriphagus sp. D3-2-R+10]
MTSQDLVVSILGVVLVLSGFAIRYWVGNRRFKRRGPGGLQHYSSYSKALIVTAIERIANLLSIPIILGGIFLLAFWWMYVREIVLSRNKNAVKNNTECKAETTAHFLVPAEKGFGTKKLRNPKESELSLCYYGIIVRLTFSSYSRLH